VPIPCDFLPKYRRHILTDGIDVWLKEIFLETAAMYGFEILDMEVMPDHVHMLIDCDPVPGIADCIAKLKPRSSHIIRNEVPNLRSLPSLWTRSTFISSVGAVSLQIVKNYINNQKG